MDGIINIYKPAGISSFACVSQVRRALNIKKAGHAGTLDPQATGVLPVCVGKGTKCVDSFLNMPKRYVGEITFGIKTDTCDIWGEKKESLEVNSPELLKLTFEDICRAANNFKGEIEQVPPDYAAVKICGVPAYKLAREGKSFEMRSKRITIYDINVLRFELKAGTYPTAVIDVKCSRGTYIRSLFRDIGNFLGIYGCMSALERTEYGFLKAEDAICPERLKDGKNIPFYKPDFVLKDLPYIVLNGKDETKYRTGVAFSIHKYENGINNGDTVRVYTENGIFLATAKAAMQNDGTLILKTDKFFDCEGQFTLGVMRHGKER